MDRGKPVDQGTLALLPVLILFMLVFEALLVGCDPGKGSDVQETTSAQAARQVVTGRAEGTIRRPIERTTARPADGGQATMPPPNAVEVAAAGIDESSIRRHLARLTGTSPAPLSSGAPTIAERGSVEGRRAAAEYMAQSFEKLGVPARILTFTSGYGRGFNVEATLRGTEGAKHLWVTAHLDSAHNAGANDDASGLVSILMVAKALERLDLKHTIHFVAYDLEEVGLHGSARYVGSTVEALRKREGKSAIIGNLNSDMIGYEEGSFDAEIVTCGRGGAIADAVFRASEMIASPVELYETCLPGLSDHRRFWKAGLPAVWIFERGEDGPYPWHHQPGDKINNLNFSYLRSMIRLTAAATTLLAAADDVN